jgi:hypothetical protein
MQAYPSRTGSPGFPAQHGAKQWTTDTCVIEKQQFEEYLRSLTKISCNKDFFEQLHAVLFCS